MKLTQLETRRKKDDIIEYCKILNKMNQGRWAWGWVKKIQGYEGKGGGCNNGLAQNLRREWITVLIMS